MEHKPFPSDPEEQANLVNTAWVPAIPPEDYKGSIAKWTTVCGEHGLSYDYGTLCNTLIKISDWGTICDEAERGA